MRQDSVLARVEDCSFTRFRHLGENQGPMIRWIPASSGMTEPSSPVSEDQFEDLLSSHSTIEGKTSGSTQQRQLSIRGCGKPHSRHPLASQAPRQSQGGPMEASPRMVHGGASRSWRRHENSGCSCRCPARECGICQYDRKCEKDAEIALRKAFHRFGSFPGQR